MGNIPDLIFLNNVGTCSSSKGNVPQSSAYRMTPHDHTSTSGPAYSLPDMTLKKITRKIRYHNFFNEKKIKLASSCIPHTAG